MRQKFSVTVADVPMTISCEETEESIQKAETELDTGMRALLDAPGSNCNKMEAAILLALDYCTRLAHAKERVRELEDYVNAADPNGDQFGASLLRGENERLRGELEVSRSVNDTLLEDNTTLYSLHAKSEKQITDANARADRMHDQVLALMKEVQDLRGKLASTCVETRDLPEGLGKTEPAVEVPMTDKEKEVAERYAKQAEATEAAKTAEAAETAKTAEATQQ